MNRIRVLIVDDSTMARGMITSALDTPELHVVGSAANGTIALSKIAQLQPEIVLLDMEMPEMDGIETLRRIREKHQRLPVVMFSSLTERSPDLAMEAFSLGAGDYLTKPSGREGGSFQEALRKLLVPKLVALARPGNSKDNGTPSWWEPSFANPSKTGAKEVPQDIKQVERPSSIEPLPMATKAPTPARAVRPSAANDQDVRPRLVPQILAIASSTGGPNALIEIIPALPADFPIPIVIVQHMPPIFTNFLAQRLAGLSKLRVIESVGGEALRAGMVYVAPGNRHLEIVRDGTELRTLLSDGPPENSVRPSADVLFRSLARLYGPTAMCVVLTGMGSDGLLGAREIVQAGGRVLAQSGATCVVWGMPRAVEQAGLCESVLPISEMADGIAQRVLNPRANVRNRSGG